MENVVDLWQDIEDLFLIANGPRVQQLKAELADCKQKELSIVAFFGKLKLLWDEMMDYDQFSLCRCGGCKCKIGQKIAKKQKEEQIRRFLMGVDGNLYKTVRSNLLAIKPLPLLNRVYLALVQEELVKIKTRGKDDHCEFMALAAHANLKPKGQGEIQAMKYLTVFKLWDT